MSIISNTKRVISVFIVLSLIVLSISSCELYDPSYTSTTTNDSTSIMASGKNVKVTFIDVGQGDSELITSDYGNMLIDAGEKSEVQNVIDTLNRENVKTIDYFVLTHPHSDHIGGAEEIIKQFNVKKVLLPDVEHTSKTYENLIDTLIKKDISVEMPVNGDNYNMGDINFNVLAPFKKTYDNLNNYSIVLKMTYGKNKFLFTGDSEKQVENEILANNDDVSVDVLKVGHHGSHTSTSEKYLKAISPSIAIISCAEVNDYGHPHKEILDLLNKYNVKTYRTYTNGNVSIITDGETISVLNNETNNNVTQENTTEKLIKGNINSRGEKIYHMPDGANYDKTNPEELFQTEEDAVNAGYRKSKN